MENVVGYNILMKLDAKTLVGETSSNMSINAKIKESLTKADKGNTNREVTGHDVAFTVNGVMQRDPEGTLTSLDSDALFEKAMAKGASAQIPFVYTRGTGKSYQGNCIITSYSEDTNADGTAAYSLACSAVGDVTPVEA